MSSPRFCSSCGGPLSVDAKFCNRCGGAIAQGPTSSDVHSDTIAVPRRPLWPVGLTLGAVGLLVLFAVVLANRIPDGVPTVTQPPAVVSETPAAAVPAVARGPYFTPSTEPQNPDLYAKRLADQIDLDRQTARVLEMRFQLRSQALTRNPWGADHAQRPREAWAVPMGVVDRGGRPALAVATTRCVVDYRYPTLAERTDWVNLALFTGEGRPAEVFRITSPTDLPGVGRIFDQYRDFWVHDRVHLSGPSGDRYFGELQEHPEWGVEAVLPVGDWNTTDGVDIAVLYFPLDDPGTQALRPQPRNRLDVDNPERALHDALAPRTSLWGDTFRFAMVSEQCMAAMQADFRESERENERNMNFVGFFAGLAAVALLGPALPGVLSSEVLGLITGRAQTLIGSQFVGIVWRTITRVLGGERLEDIVWDEGRSLVLSFARDSGMQRILLAGVVGDGLSRQQQDDVIATVRAFVDGAGESTRLSVVSRDGTASERCDGSSSCVGSILTPSSGGSGLDVAAELLLRGLVRLDTRDEAVLAQQPGLLEAARNAITNPATRDESAIADRIYQEQVVALAGRLLR